mmetsp:Transcript_74632/g.205745  ORF Transcript_74632/g.205745 Transcript_74632/m.205745 type:complete len:85 (-) Transcript_74632:1583-1837(-)
MCSSTWPTLHGPCMARVMMGSLVSDKAEHSGTGKSPFLGINPVINHDGPTEMLQHTINILQQLCKLHIMTKRVENVLPLQKGIH